MNFGFKTYVSKEWTIKIINKIYTTSWIPPIEYPINDSGIHEMITPATGTKLSTNTIMAKVGSCGKCIKAKPVVVITVFTTAISTCVSITMPKVLTNFLAKK